ncbi:MAG: thioesterase family protein [Ferrimicrobium sp.]
MYSESNQECFYEELEPHCYSATDHCRGPWDPNACHGGPPSALATYELATYPGEQERHLAQIHIDLYGKIPVAPIAFSTSQLRSGSRVELLETVGKVEGRTVVVARGWRMHTEPNRVPMAAPMSLPDLDEGAPDADIALFPYGAAIEWRFVEGAFTTPGPATVWATPRVALLRDRLVPNEVITALIADSANGVSSVLDFSEYLFVPTSIEIALLRLPTEPTVGLSARTTVDPDGIGITRATLFDSVGIYGHLLQTLYVEAH